MVVFFKGGVPRKAPVDGRRAAKEGGGRGIFPQKVPKMATFLYQGNVNVLF